MDLVLISDINVQCFYHQHGIDWSTALLYGQRYIDSCLAVLFAEQSPHSLNRSVALSYT